MGAPEIEAFLTCLADGYGSVELPFALARKYLNADKELAWQYVFPSDSLSTDSRSGIVRYLHLDRQRQITLLLIGSPASHECYSVKRFRKSLIVSSPILMMISPGFYR